MKQPIPGFLIGYEAIGNAMIHFNLAKPPFNNQKVRQAVAYAIDKDEILQGVFWGLGEVVNNQPFSKRSRNYIPVKERKRDLAKAKQLMAEAGYPNGFKTEFLEPDISYYVESALIAVGQLKQIGIEATLKTVDRSPFYPMLRKGDYYFSLAGIDEKYDWDDVYYMYLHSSELGINNVYGYSNKEVDHLLDRGRTTMRREDRIPTYKRVIEIISEELPVLYLNKLSSSYALADYVKGFKKGSCGRNAWHGGGPKYYWLDK
jgi:peptide/nickel transport system substrate-binding protein